MNTDARLEALVKNCKAALEQQEDGVPTATPAHEELAAEFLALHRLLKTHGLEALPTEWRVQRTPEAEAVVASVRGPLKSTPAVVFEMMLHRLHASVALAESMTTLRSDMKPTCLIKAIEGFTQAHMWVLHLDNELKTAAELALAAYATMARLDGFSDRDVERVTEIACKAGAAEYDKGCEDMRKSLGLK